MEVCPMIQNPFRRIRLVYRRSSPLLKCAVAGCIILAVITLLVIRSAILKERAQEEADRAKAAQKEQENARLEAIMEQEGSVEWNETIAREELDMLPGGSEVITVTPES